MKTTRSSRLFWLASLTLAGAAQAQAPALPNGTGLPAPKPGIAAPGQPSLPGRPLDANPLTPSQPSLGNPTGAINKCLGSPVRLTLDVVPPTLRSGTPVELRISTQCAPKTPLALEFNAHAPGETARGPGDTMVAFLNQIPRSVLAAGSTSATVRLTPRGLSNSVSLMLTASTRVPTSLTSNQVAVRIEGDGIPATAGSIPAVAGPGCRPTLSLNMIPSAVIGGASVPVDLRMSCALQQEAQVQIISSNSTLLPGPPGNLVRIPAGQTSLAFQLTAGRSGSGTVSLRALLSNPAMGGMTPADSLSVNN